MKDYQKNYWRDTNLFIGPEGGFSANELSWFKHEQIPQILLGNQLVDGNVLRAETL